MVQTYQSPVRVYKYPFEMVMAAYEKRFPTCPMIPIFVSCEITHDYKSTDGANDVIERKCQLNIDVPYILKKLAGVDFVYFMQKNSLDRRNRTLTIDAHNQSFSSRVIINETCKYYVHAENEDWTCFEQSASLDVKSFFGFESTVEKIAVKQYSANIGKGKEIIEHFITELQGEGVTFIPRFVEKVEDESEVANVDDTANASPRRRLSAVDNSENTDTLDNTKLHNLSRSRTGTLVKRSLTPQRSNEADLKLETEYIQRFLGELTALEESRLCELKYMMPDTQKGKIPNDAHLLRFLRARDFEVGKARDLLHTSLLWRKQHNVDKILSTYEPPTVLHQFFPGCWHKYDNVGRPVFVLRLGLLDIKGLLRAVGEDGIVKFVMSICEDGLRRCEQATKLRGKPISAWTMLVDLEGLSMRHLWRPGVSALLRVIEIVEAHYPETMGLALIVRAPRVFPVLWTLIGPFIDEKTRNKFILYASNTEFTQNLVQHIPEKFIPDFLGGSCFSMAPEAGLVPKKLYSDVVEEDEGSEKVLHSVYETGYAFKGIPHEVLSHVQTPGCVLTWDFDVIKGHCEFSVLHSTRVIRPERPTSPTMGGPLSPLTTIGKEHTTNTHPLICDRTLQLGPDVTVETKPFICKDGDSVQGSHYCNRPGSYILQWKLIIVDHHHSSTIDPQSTHFEFPISAQKCKIAYYQDLIDSESFKGSMASLESCRSSFSSLSVAGSSQKKSQGSKEGRSTPV